MNLLYHPLTQKRLDEACLKATGSYIFHGLASIGKASAAFKLARELNCQGEGNSRKCTPCLQFESSSFPDLVLVMPLADKHSISLEQIRQLAGQLSLSPYYSFGVRVVIIDQAHSLTPEAQSALLKLIEEPPPRTVFILVADELDSLLLTVQSRLQAIYFVPVQDKNFQEWIMSTHGLDDESAKFIVDIARGAPGIAVKEIKDPKLRQSRELRMRSVEVALGGSIFERLILAKTLVDQKEDLLRWASLVQRSLLTSLSQATSDNETVACKCRAVETFRFGLMANVSPKVALERLMLELYRA